MPEAETNKTSVRIDAAALSQLLVGVTRDEKKRVPPVDSKEAELPPKNSLLPIGCDIY